MKRKTNFDRYLEEQLKDKDFAERFKKAGDAWDVALQLAALRKKSGLSQKELAQKVGTSQQQISRLESPDYEGHSLSMLRRVTETLGATVKVEIRYKKSSEQFGFAEKKSHYGVKKKDDKSSTLTALLNQTSRRSI
jgi:transcriptional regulator with XRE-family HTH domain